MLLVMKEIVHTEVQRKIFYGIQFDIKVVEDSLNIQYTYSIIGQASLYYTVFYLDPTPLPLK